MKNSKKSLNQKIKHFCATISGTAKTAFIWKKENNPGEPREGLCKIETTFAKVPRIGQILYDSLGKRVRLKKRTSILERQAGGLQVAIFFASLRKTHLNPLLQK